MLVSPAVRIFGARASVTAPLVASGGELADPRDHPWCVIVRLDGATLMDAEKVVNLAYDRRRLAASRRRWLQPPSYANPFHLVGDSGA
jgi:hypothetical protein